MPSSEAVLRLGAVCAAVVLILGSFNSKLGMPAKIHWDWPIIAAYTLLFAGVSVLYWRSGSKAFALALLATAVGAAIFDIIENSLALDGRHSAAASNGKWICYWAAVALLAPLFLAASGGLARATAWLFIAAAVAGIAGLFGTPPKSMVPAISVMTAAFALFIYIAVRDPRILLT